MSVVHGYAPSRCVRLRLRQSSSHTVIVPTMSSPSFEYASITIPSAVRTILHIEQAVHQHVSPVGVFLRVVLDLESGVVIFGGGDRSRVRSLRLSPWRWQRRRR